MTEWLSGLLRQRRPPARRVAAASLAFAIGVAVVTASAERGGSLGPWSGFVGMIGLMVLVAGLVQGDLRVLVAAAAVLGTSAVIGGNGRLHGVAGAVVTASLGAALLLVVEVGQWSAELRDRLGPRGKDLRRVGVVLAAALGGGAIGGIALAMAATTPATAGGLVLVIAGSVACCLVAVLALFLAADSRS
jgi:hypothetical protein